MGPKSDQGLKKRGVYRYLFRYRLLERLHATTYSSRRFSCLLRRCRLGTLRVH
jgi:hypothetical protein